MTIPSLGSPKIRLEEWFFLTLDVGSFMIESLKTSLEPPFDFLELAIYSGFVATGMQGSDLPLRGVSTYWTSPTSSHVLSIKLEILSSLENSNKSLVSLTTTLEDSMIVWVLML